MSELLVIAAMISTAVIGWLIYELHMAQQKAIDLQYKIDILEDRWDELRSILHLDALSSGEMMSSAEWTWTVIGAKRYKKQMERLEREIV